MHASKFIITQNNECCMCYSCILSLYWVRLQIVTIGDIAFQKMVFYGFTNFSFYSFVVPTFLISMDEWWIYALLSAVLQAEEAQRLKRKRKAETLRLLEMERRQKQRLEEIRESQKKVSNISLQYTNDIFLFSHVAYMVPWVLILPRSSLTSFCWLMLGWGNYKYERTPSRWSKEGAWQDGTEI